MSSPAAPWSQVFQATDSVTGCSFPAPSDLPLLVAAEHAGLRPVSSCRNGTCRSCISHLTRGEVYYSVAWPGLSPDEKAAGFILPCVACAASDVTLRFGAWDAFD
ncbi:2Fe-2S iron-sulfur cluster-binding protein [Variovorax sp. HJSM1_2]|uniref:2Fe-2S iron-sulfur cluster-binding protein n=1 Tax=Variovorax sp. HJSM1_2 TaxID=3366263 RepID=UPI003BC01841